MAQIEDYFSIQVFFIIFRECLECGIVISVLLSFVNQRKDKHHDQEKVQRKLKLQIWIGAILGLVICFIIGLTFVFLFYFVGKDYWSYTERIWEGVFSVLSSLIITIMGIGLLRINKVMKIKWWIKLGDAYNNDAEEEEEEKKKQSFSKKYFLAILPLVTTLREGLEAIVFIANQPPSSIPLSVICGISFGVLVGYLLYKGGNKLSLQYFLIFSTCFLYIVSAGLMSRGVWFFELERYVRACGVDVSETGSGPGSYDIATSVWHVNCCNGLTDGWWMVLNAIFGWTNSATYGSVFSYIIYWVVVIVWLNIKLYEEREGVLPFVPIKWQLKRIRKKIRLYEVRKSHLQQAQSSEQQQQVDTEVPESQGLLQSS
ncbi:ftrA High affinity iron permease ftrA [Candida maltosa Xu316]